MKKVIKLKARIAEREVKQIFIDTDFIRLDAALKLCDAVGSGGIAKMKFRTARSESTVRSAFREAKSFTAEMNSALTENIMRS